jgi:hypothetical protein
MFLNKVKGQKKKFRKEGNRTLNDGFGNHYFTIKLPSFNKSAREMYFFLIERNTSFFY